MNGPGESLRSAFHIGREDRGHQETFTKNTQQTEAEPIVRKYFIGMYRQEPPLYVKSSGIAIIRRSGAV